MENILGERTQDGRFAQGNKGGSGNPYAQQTAAFRALLAEILTEDDIRDVIKALIKRAKEGFFPAIKMFLERFIGKPESGRGQGSGVRGQNERVPMPACPAVRLTAAAGQTSSGTAPQAANDKTPPPKSETLRTILDALNLKPNNPSFHSLSAGIKLMANMAAAGRRLPAHAFSR